ncbi:WbqC family protein [Elizabethkingia anophelis]|uniref:WbqC family protein n=1 Tax=Elizabethkingia anophelis TaxID=1117645 RepID=UPI0020B1BFA9|nr:WbqC family protein [Elizabethkingia anophelis]UTF94156.1 WbqC family protein [Elizabethkingia anophelis]
MKAGVMQPYFFPYIGYFQMIKAVDCFVFYDDVNYIKGGWINRNRILINNDAKYITVPLNEASSNKLINEICIKHESKEYRNIIKTIIQNYGKAPYFEEVFSLINKVINSDVKNISELAIKSVTEVCKYLNIETRFKISSEYFRDTKGLDRTQRLLAICKRLNAAQYINAIGGLELYSKKDFICENIELKFMQPSSVYYKQFGDEFFGGLSIIDVLMFNSPEEINIMLSQYKLI